MKSGILRILAGDRRGVSAIEYGLIAAGISIVIAASVTNIGASLKTKFQDIATALQ